MDDSAAVVQIAVPLRYMHSPAECVDLEDIRLCAELVAAFALAGPDAMIENQAPAGKAAVINGQDNAKGAPQC